MDPLEQARRVIALEIEELQRLLERVDDSFIASVDLLKATVERGAKILIVGVGKSGNIGSKLSTSLLSTNDMTVSNMKKHFYSNHSTILLPNELEDDPNFKQKKINGASSLAQVCFLFFSFFLFYIYIR